MHKRSENSSIQCSKHDFTLFWAKLAAAYPRTSTTSGTMMRYYERLSRFTQKQLLKAGDIAADELEQFPSPARLIKIVKLAVIRPPRPKLLDEPRPTPEQIEQNRAKLKEIIETIGKEKS